MAIETNTADIQFQIQKIYTKDISFEIPKGANAFKQEWKPELNLALNTKVTGLPEANMYEVVLTVEADVKCETTNAFKVEVQQAGIFLISNMKDGQLDHAQHAFCPNILYPYAREAISDLVTKGGFPQLCLASVNFDMIYHQKQQEQKRTTN